MSDTPLLELPKTTMARTTSRTRNELEMDELLLTIRRDLRQRCRLPELMDDPQLDREAHRRALQGLRRVNRFSRSAAIVWPSIRSLLPRPGCKAVRVLDLACGGGDVAVEIARRAFKAGGNIRVDGCDISSFAVEQSTRLAASHNLPNTHFFPLNALSDDLPVDYDVLMCSLFLHHLSREDACLLLCRMRAAAQQLVLVNDLRRTRLGYALAWLACRALTRSHIVHTDGPLSVRSAFTTGEVQRLAVEAGLASAVITEHWPQRFLLSWRKPT